MAHRGPGKAVCGRVVDQRRLGEPHARGMAHPSVQSLLGAPNESPVQADIGPLTTVELPGST
jgi:hypothetical protein